MVELHLLLGSGRLSPYENIIRKEFDVVVSKIREKLLLDGVDVVIYDNPEWAIPETGIGGYTPNEHLVFISLNPEVAHFEQNLKNNLKRTIAHELHHAMRWRNPGYGETLFEALITEGLADHFDMEINETDIPEPRDTALTELQVNEFVKKASQEFDSKEYDHKEWFFGSKDIPRWTGYALGFKIVGDYLKRNPEKKPSMLYAVKADKFR